MKKFFIWTMLLFKRQLKNIVFDIFLILLPLCIAAMNHAAADDSSPVVGIYFEENSSFMEEIQDLLLNNSSYVNFEVTTSVEELSQLVLNETYECGYVFGTDLEAKLDSRKFNKTITLITKKNNILSSLSNEIVFSQLFRAYGENIALSYFDEISADDAQSITDIYNRYLDNGGTYSVEFETLDSAYQDITTTSSVFPLRGLLAVMAYALGSFGALTWIRDNKKGLFATSGTSFVTFSRFLYIFIPTVLFMCSALVSILLSPVSKGLSNEVAAALIYTLIISVWGFILTYINNATVLISLIPLLVTASVIFTPVVLDISMYLPFVKIVRYAFMPYYYLIM